MIPTSVVLADKLHEAGLIPDPNLINKIVITAQAGKPVVMELTMWVRDTRSLEVITNTLGNMREDPE